MRCYFLRDGHICAVELIAEGASDAEAVRLSTVLFEDRVARKQAIHGFEIWDRSRFVHRHPPLPPKFGVPTGGGPQPHSA